MKGKEWNDLMIGVLGITGMGIGALHFSEFVLTRSPVVLKMACGIISYWFIAIVPVILMIVHKDRLSDYGFTKDKLAKQILLGIGIGAGMSVILTLIPHLSGLGKYVDNGRRYGRLWQFVYEFVYCIVAVGLVEEVCFRGFIFTRIQRISNKDYVAVIGSSALFGLFHLFTGNVVQMIVTFFIGVFFCLCRLKIKNCTTLSLIICHGIYDALITVWASYW